MGMTIDKCINMFMAKEKCIMRETRGTDTDCNSNNCDSCPLCYEQGTMGAQRKALRFAVDTMRRYQKIAEIMSDNLNDIHPLDRQPYRLSKIHEILLEGGQRWGD